MNLKTTYMKKLVIIGLASFAASVLVFMIAVQKTDIGLWAASEVLAFAGLVCLFVNKINESNEPKSVFRRAY